MKLPSILGIRGVRDKPKNNYGVRLISFSLVEVQADRHSASRQNGCQGMISGNWKSR